MVVRDENQGARAMMNWHQPPYKGTGSHLSEPEPAYYRGVGNNESGEPTDCEEF